MNARDAFEEIDHLLLVVREAVGIELIANGRVLRRLFLVLVEEPFERRAIAELVFRLLSALVQKRTNFCGAANVR